MVNHYPSPLLHSGASLSLPAPRALSSAFQWELPEIRTLMLLLLLLLQARRGTEKHADVQICCLFVMLFAELFSLFLKIEQSCR